MQQSSLSSDTIMAANQPEGTRSIETKEAPEDVSGKKKSKFQAFKKLFVKKKRKESPAPSTESNLKPSQSSSDVSASGANTTAFHPADEPVARSNMGNKAVSHDSVFVSEMENSSKEDISQENTPGKVKVLQLQLQQNIRIGSPPQAIVPKKLEDSGALSEDDGLPRSPPEITSLHDILAQSSGKSTGSAKRRSSLSLEGTDSEDEPESSESSSHLISPLHTNVHLCPISPASHFPPVDFTSPATFVAFLDYSAAKHKIAVKPKKRRRPAMNVKPTKVEAQQLPSPEKRSAEHEAPNEQVICTEDMAVQESEVDITGSLSASEMNASNLSTELCNTTVDSETSPLGKPIASVQNESMYNEADVNFLGKQLSIGDLSDTAEKDTERKKESSLLLKTCGFQPCEAQNEIAAIDKRSKFSHSKVEIAHLDLSQDLGYGVSESSITKQEGTLESGMDEGIVNEVTDEKAFACLSHVQNDLPEVSLLVNETSQGNVLKTEPVTAVAKDNEYEEIGTFAPECVTVCESVHAESPVTMEITLSEVITEASDQLVENVEVDGSIENEPSPFEQKVETFDYQRIIESSKDQFDVGKESVLVTHTNYSFSILPGGGAHDSDLSNKESSTDDSKATKPADANTNSKLKTANKPVRFTVAPAWQRALSTGSDVKDSISCKNMVANTVRSESFDGTDDSVMDVSFRKSEKLNETVKMKKEEPCIPFGVRLRSTSSSVKYSDEHPEHLIAKQSSTPVDTGSLAPDRSMHTPAKALHIHSDVLKIGKPAPTSEDRTQLRPKAEELSPRENKEPAWITVAKLKQKGFQGHPLAREQSVTTESDKAEGITECFMKKNISTQELDVKKSEPACTDIPAVTEEVQVEPGRNMRSSQPQNADEPPWFSLAKKKAKAWSEMPQSVQ
ncbi:acrosomal protein KIAA1210 homolog isoform X2 [Pseudophryne corroboree]|uniref:acrosomal protein KIAA1210 homolog isoform X2 n=1 Tax=Pseudophryne corroboree TaxID=495146 RepID=UPI0030816968